MRLVFVADTFTGTLSPSKTLSGTWIDRETCFRLFLATTLETTNAEIMVERITKSRLFDAFIAARDRRTTIRRCRRPGRVMANDRGNSR